MHKAYSDVLRVIELGKPVKVIDLFISDYLLGIALRPMYAAEKEYEELKQQPDREPQQAVIDPDTEEVWREAVDYNAIRDSRIAELETDYPHLVEPAPEVAYRTVTDSETLEEVQEPYELPIPDVIARRPLPPVIDVEGWKASTGILRDQFKAERAAAVAKIIVTVATGKSFDGDEDSQTRMARAIVGLPESGQDTMPWVLADNTIESVTRLELIEALQLAGAEQSAIWIPV